MSKQIICILAFLLFVVSIFPSALNHLSFAKQLMSERLFDEAYMQVNQVITEYPNSYESFDARIIMSEILIERKLFQDARMQLMLLLRNPFQMTYEQRTRTYYVLGLTYYKENKFEEAIESFDKLFLDYRDSEEAKRAISDYFDSFFNLNDYQSVIVKSRDMLKLWRSDEILSELYYYQARAYFLGNMSEQANKIILEIRSKFPQSTAAWKAIELQILLLEKESGKNVAIGRLESILKETISRSLEEKLSWLLINYYLDIGEIVKAKNKIDFVINKFNMSEDISMYLLTWLKIMTDDKDIKPIIEKEEFIINVSKGKDEYDRIIYYLAKMQTLAQNYWEARNYLDGNMSALESDLLRFDYKFLYADIFNAQGQYLNSLKIYNSLLNNYSHIGKNYELLMQLGNIYLNQYNQKALALNYYRQAVSLAKNTEESINVLVMIAECLEGLKLYSEALETLSQIPIDKIEDVIFKDQIQKRVILLQVFYHSNISEALSHYLSQKVAINKELSYIDYASILALKLKQFDVARQILESHVTYDARIERVKIYFLLAYKHFLENNPNEQKFFLDLIGNELNQLGNNIKNNDRLMINCFNSFLLHKTKVNIQNIDIVLSYINSESISSIGIEFKNFFRYQLWIYYYNNSMSKEMIEVAHEIKQDSFIGEIGFQRVNVLLANYYFNTNDYSKAYSYFNKAKNFLTLAYPDYYYKYAMTLYELQNITQSLEILQKLVLNNVDNPLLVDARNMIITYWLNRNMFKEVLDILNQIPPLKRIDSDYRNFYLVYNKQSNYDKAKESLLYVQSKTLEELERLAILHLLTGDKVMSEYTWTDLLKKTKNRTQQLNAYASLANLYYIEEKYSDAVNNYEQFFKIYSSDVFLDDLILAPDLLAKEFIISCYLIGNRPKAESTMKSLKNFIDKNPELLAEIKLNEGIYYANMEPRRATRPLSQVIEDAKTPNEVAFKAMFWRGVVLMQDNKLDNAERDFLAAINTSDIELKNQINLKLGTLYLNKGNPEKALDYYYQVILNDKNGTLAKNAAHNFAVVAKQMQDWDKAIAAYKVIMDRWGQTHLDAETRLTIAFSFYQANQFDQALNLFNQLVSELKDDELLAEAQYWIAECLVGKKEYNEGITAFQNVKKLYPKATEWIGISELRIAETFLRQGYVEKAMQLFNEIIRIHGASSDLGKEAMKYINQ